MGIKIACAAVAAILVALAALAGCAPERVENAYHPNRQFSRYRHALIDLGVDRSEIGERWLDAGARALEHEAASSLPLSETIIFDPAEPRATVYRFAVGGRQTAIINVERDRGGPLLFADVYRVSANGSDDPQKIASIDPQSGSLEFRTRRSGTYLFRVQPEIGRGGRVQVRIDVGR